MFKFGFGDPQEPHAGDGQPGPQEAAEEQHADAAADSVGAEEVLESESKPTGAQETVFVSPQLSLTKGVVSNAQAASILSDGRVADNDLIAGVYEGGFKTWEGGVDLAQFVALRLQQAAEAAAAQPSEQQQQDVQQGTQQQQQRELSSAGRVMELGCGHGLPGLVALWAGAEVHFQDYNRAVLTTLTMQNVAANRVAWATRRAASGGGGDAPSGSGADPPPARYFVGSWDALPGVLEGAGLARSYDLVLTAETIYSVEAMRSLYRCIVACLRPGTGVAYVAAKSYYFGVGGGTAAFARLVEAEGRYSCEAVAVVDDGASNKREILRLAPVAGGGGGA